MRIFKTLLASGVLLAAMAYASADNSVQLDNTATSQFDAVITRQATISVPGDITFNVTNIGVPTTNASSPQVSLTNIVLASGEKITLYVAANNLTFQPVPGGTTTYTAADVSFAGTSGTGVSGVSGPVSLTTTAQAVGSSSANNPTSLAITVPFTLASDVSAVDFTGTQTLGITFTATSV